MCLHYSSRLLGKKLGICRPLTSPTITGLRCRGSVLPCHLWCWQKSCLATWPNRELEIRPLGQVQRGYPSKFRNFHLKVRKPSGSKILMYKYICIYIFIYIYTYSYDIFWYLYIFLYLRVKLLNWLKRDQTSSSMEGRLPPQISRNRRIPGDCDETQLCVCLRILAATFLWNTPKRDETPQLWAVMRTGWTFLVVFGCFSCFSLVGSLLALGRWDQNFKSCLRNWNVRTPGSRNNVSSFSVQELRLKESKKASTSKDTGILILSFQEFCFICRSPSIYSCFKRTLSPFFSAPTSQEKFPHWITASHDTGTVDDLFGNPMGDVEWDRFRSANNSDID